MATFIGEQRNTRPDSGRRSRSADDDDDIFSPVHGDNVALSDDGKIASRKDGTFDGALCPIWSSVRDRIYYLKVKEINQNWSGGMSLALTASEPTNENLPRNAAFEALGDSEPATARGSRKVNAATGAHGINKEKAKRHSNGSAGWLFVRIELKAQLARDQWVSFRVDFKAKLVCYGINGQPNRSQAIDDPMLLNHIEKKQPIWALVDVYGPVTSVELLGEPLVSCLLLGFCSVSLLVLLQ